MSRKIFVGGRGTVKKIPIGGGAEIPVQSMWKESLHGASDETLYRIAERLSELERSGLKIMRFAVPDEESAEAVTKLSRLTGIPLVADIHFNYRLALACMTADVAAVRINPGNIGGAENVEAVIKKARETGTVLRIGVNSGSLPKDLQKLPKAEALVKAAEREMEIFDHLQFTDYAVSLKASNIEDTVRANELFASRFDVPLHLGVTEAGPAITGAVKSTVAFYRLLTKGIGDTLRVSLSAPCELEVIAGVEILRSVGKIKGGVTLISCPRCGRNGFDVHSFLNRWETRLYALQKDITVAVMGCAVNGPGEAKNADIGITGGNDFAVIFKHGKVVQNILLKQESDNENNKTVDEAFERELRSL